MYFYLIQISNTRFYDIKLQFLFVRKHLFNIKYFCIIQIIGRLLCRLKCPDLILKIIHNSEISSNYFYLKNI